jgi:hypothetical protein
VDGSISWFIAILQGESRSEFNKNQYAACMEESCGFPPLDPNGGGTFVGHHMVFHRRHVEELLTLITRRYQEKNPQQANEKSWPQIIMGLSHSFYRFSEYKTYSSFMVYNHPDSFHYHPLDHFGKGGIRFREANEVISKMLQDCSYSDAGISYAQVVNFTFSNHSILSNDSLVRINGDLDQMNIPPYVQLDHVYGLRGIDLRLSDTAIKVLSSIPSSESLFPAALRHHIQDEADNSSLQSLLASTQTFNTMNEILTRKRSGTPQMLIPYDPNDCNINVPTQLSMITPPEIKALKLRELKSGIDISTDLFYSPLTVAIVSLEPNLSHLSQDVIGILSCNSNSTTKKSGDSTAEKNEQSNEVNPTWFSSIARARDDSSIRRMTMGTILKNYPFIEGQNSIQTTPRRPPKQKYVYCSNDGSPTETPIEKPSNIMSLFRSNYVKAV